jgi:hypothetical protein
MIGWRGLVFAASNQRMDAAVSTATAAMRGARVFCDLHNVVGARRRNQMRADHGQRVTRGRSDHANEDHSAKGSHWVTPVGPTGPWQQVLVGKLNMNFHHGGGRDGSGRQNWRAGWRAIGFLPFSSFAREKVEMPCHGQFCFWRL